MIRTDDRHTFQHGGDSFWRHRRSDSEQTVFTRRGIVLEGHAGSIYGILWLAVDLDKLGWLSAADAQAGAHCDYRLVPRTVDRVAVASPKAVEPARAECARTHQCSRTGIAEIRE